MEKGYKFKTQKSILDASTLSKKILEIYDLSISNYDQFIVQLASHNPNQIYRLSSPSFTLFLYVFHHNFTSPRQVELEIERLHRLNYFNDAVPRPLTARTGDLFIPINSPEGQRYMALFEKMIQQFDLPPELEEIHSHYSNPQLNPDFFPTQKSVLSTSALEQEFLPRFNLKEPIQCKLVREGYTDVYNVTSANGVYWLRIYKTNMETIESLETTVNMLLRLQDLKMPVSIPNIANDGSFVQNLDAPEGLRHALLYSDAGDRPLFDHGVLPSVLKEQFIEYGQLTAHFFNTADKISPTYKRNHYDTQFLIHHSLLFIKPFLSQRLNDFQFLQEIGESLEQQIIELLPREKPYYGICHGDLHPGNASD